MMDAILPDYTASYPSTQYFSYSCNVKKTILKLRCTCDKSFLRNMGPYDQLALRNMQKMGEYSSLNKAGIEISIPTETQLTLTAVQWCHRLVLFSNINDPHSCITHIHIQL